MSTFAGGDYFHGAGVGDVSDPGSMPELDSGLSGVSAGDPFDALGLTADLGDIVSDGGDGNPVAAGGDSTPTAGGDSPPAQSQIDTGPSADGTPAIVVTARSLVQPPPALFGAGSTYFFAPSGMQFQALRQAGRNFAAQGHSYLEIGQLIGRDDGQFNFQLDSSAQYGVYDFYQDTANFAVGVVSEGFFEGSTLGYVAMTGGEQIVGYASNNWSPSQMAWWQGWWTAGWNAAQSGNYPVQVGSPLQMPVPLN